MREEAAKDAELVIEYGLHQFERWLTKVSAEPAILDFRARVRAACGEELEKLCGSTAHQGVCAEVGCEAGNSSRTIVGSATKRARCRIRMGMCLARIGF